MRQLLCVCCFSSPCRAFSGSNPTVLLKSPPLLNMKSTIFLSVAVLGIALPCFSQSQGETKVIGGIHTGESVAGESRETNVKRVYVVKRAFTQKVGKRNVTIQEVEPPSPEEAMVEKTASPSTQAEPTNIEAHISPKLIVISATVSGTGEDVCSKITLWHEGKKCVAFSRVDFHLMSGFTQFKVNGRPYFLIENITEGELAGKHRIPPSGFVVTDIEEGDTRSRQILADLHELYRVEQKKLREAYEKRKQNAARQKVPEPDKPVTIRFWKRDMSKEQQERGAK